MGAMPGAEALGRQLSHGKRMLGALKLNWTPVHCIAAGGANRPWQQREVAIALGCREYR